MKMSWVTLDRICDERRLSDESYRRLIEDSDRPLRCAAAQLSDEELLGKLRGFGFDFDRDGLRRLCEGALSAEEVARPLMESCGFRNDRERVQGEWIWICLVALWQRWWPDQACLELVDDKIQAGYHEPDEFTRAAIWLDAWSDVLSLCDAADIDSIDEFDDRFPMTQSLYNWGQDLQDALWNAGLRDRALLRARIAVCEAALGRFSDQDQLLVENRRRALAESYFEVGETDQAEELFRSWLDADPCWGFGWIGWAACHFYCASRPKNYAKAEVLLRQGFSVPGVRDRDAVAEWLQILCKETGRASEARELGWQARQLKPQPGLRSMSDRTHPDGHNAQEEVLQASSTVGFADAGPPLTELAVASSAERACQVLCV
ncbi:MAG TPA: hypothetical protein VNG13_00190 [Mycobacteriales bacterium]|nr:hypothetical protein [Mycobacteriales bacterium]